MTSTDPDHVALSVLHGEAIDYLYQMRARFEKDVESQGGVGHIYRQPNDMRASLR